MPSTHAGCLAVHAFSCCFSCSGFSLMKARMRARGSSWTTAMAAAAAVAAREKELSGGGGGERRRQMQRRRLGQCARLWDVRLAIGKLAGKAPLNEPRSGSNGPFGAAAGACAALPQCDATHSQPGITCTRLQGGSCTNRQLGVARPSAAPLLTWVGAVAGPNSDRSATATLG